jgi:hypothetical protein
VSAWTPGIDPSGLAGLPLPLPTIPGGLPSPEVSACRRAASLIFPPSLELLRADHTNPATQRPMRLARSTGARDRSGRSRCAINPRLSFSFGPATDHAKRKSGPQCPFTALIEHRTAGANGFGCEGLLLGPVGPSLSTLHADIRAEPDADVRVPASCPRLPVRDCAPTEDSMVIVSEAGRAIREGAHHPAVHGILRHDAELYPRNGVRSSSDPWRG